MNKKILMAIGLLIVILVAGVVVFLGSAKQTEKNKNIYVLGDKLMVDIGENQLSMVNLKIKGQMTGFVVNKEIFNTELQNKFENGVLALDLGVMKRTVDLPWGLVEIGSFLNSSKQQLELISGLAIIPSSNGEPLELILDIGQLQIK